MSRVEDFVRAGQVAQAAVDKLTHSPSKWPTVAEISVDALAIGGQLLAIIRMLDDAAAHRAHRRHTNAAGLEQLARASLRKLGGALEAHFTRFTGPPSGSCYRCTCGYELRGPDLVAFLHTCGTSTPASIGCKKCGGVAVRMSS